MPPQTSFWARFVKASYNVNIASKIIVPFIGLAILISIFGGYSVATWATDLTEQNAANMARSATLTTARTFNVYENQLFTYSKAIASEPALPNLIRSGDADRVRQTILPPSVSFESDFVVLCDAEGRVIINNNGPYNVGDDLSNLKLIQDAADDLTMVRLIQSPAGSIMVCGTYVSDQEGLAGYVLVGYYANADLLSKIKATTGLDVSMYSDERLMATTLPGEKIAGCSSGGCHTAGFTSSILKGIDFAKSTPRTTDMVGRSYMIDHGNVMLSGDTAGIFTVFMPMDEVIRTQNIIKGTVFLLAALLMILITTIGFFISRGIANPLRDLSGIAKKVSRGDLTPRADYPGESDEVGELALSFNKMTESLQRYTANLRKRLLELSVLYETSVSTRNVYSLENLYELIIQNASKAVNADCGSLMILDDNGTSMTLSAGYNIPASIIGKVSLEISSGTYSWHDKKTRRLDAEMKIALKKMCVAAGTVSDDKSRLLNRLDADKKIRDLLVETKSSSLLSVQLKTHDSLLGVINLGRNETKPSFADEDRNFLMTMASQAAAYIENRLLIDNLRESYIATVRALAEAIDAKDHYTRGHSTRVAKYAVAIARELKLPESDIEGVETAAYLHDVGKIGISDQILLKPGKLTLDEMETVRGHPKIGAKILSPINFPWEIVPIVFQHHERYSGGGYPNKLAYDDIHIGARILIVADSYEAMTSERPYRAALSEQTAMEELKKGSGTQFDPLVVEAFLRLLEKGISLEPVPDESQVLSE
jgi:putative nucleotidyltransferase with HDIG domain